MRKRDPNEKKRTPQPLANVVGAFLKASKLEERVEQASVVPEWELLVGKQIARVTKPGGRILLFDIWYTRSYRRFCSVWARST